MGLSVQYGTVTGGLSLPTNAAKLQSRAGFEGYRSKIRISMSRGCVWSSHTGDTAATSN